jgi:hypothetical protein
MQYNRIQMSLQSSPSGGKDRWMEGTLRQRFFLGTVFSLLAVFALACDGNGSGGSPVPTPEGSETPESQTPPVITPTQGGITPIFPEESPTPAASPTPPAVRTVKGEPGAVIKERGITISLNKIEDPWQPPTDGVAPAEGKRYVSFELTVKNKGDFALGVSPRQFALTDISGASYEATLSAGSEPRLFYEALEKGDEVKGSVAFEVDEGAAIDVLKYRPRVPGAGEVGFQFS